MSVPPAGSGASKAIEEGPPFRLLDLPRELRDKVYHYAYVPSSPDTMFIRKCEKQNRQREAWRAAKPSKLLGPLHVVSHQIHDELEEYLARLPNETITMRWLMYGNFYKVKRDAKRFARCPKVTSMVFEVSNNQAEFSYDATFCYELLALIYFFRTGGKKVQTVTFDQSAESKSYGEWSGQLEWRDHGVLPEKGDIRVTVNVRTLEISELSGSLAPFLKMELIEALEDFQGLILADQPRTNASLWLSETELVHYEAGRRQPSVYDDSTRLHLHTWNTYLSYLEWLCDEEWTYWLSGAGWQYWNLEKEEIQESPPENASWWALECEKSRGPPLSPPAVPESSRK